LIVKTPALVAVACWSTLLQSILTIHVVLLAQIFVFQHFVRTVDAQKCLVCIWIILGIQQQLVIIIIIIIVRLHLTTHRTYRDIGLLLGYYRNNRYLCRGVGRLGSGMVSSIIYGSVVRVSLSVCTGCLVRIVR